MKLKVADFGIDFLKQTKPSKYFRRRGWYRQEVRLPPNGPLDSVGEALRHLTARIGSGELSAAVEVKEVMRRGRKPLG